MERELDRWELGLPGSAASTKELRICRFDGDWSNEFITALGKCLNESRVVAAVTEGAPDLRQAIRQATIEVDMRLAAPNALAQFLTGDEFARTRQEDGQYSRRLTFERDRPRMLSQLAAFDLKVKDPKPVNHFSFTGTPGRGRR